MTTYFLLSLLFSAMGVVATTIGYLKDPNPFAGGVVAFTACAFIVCVALFTAYLVRHS